MANSSEFLRRAIADSHQAIESTAGLAPLLEKAAAMIKELA